MTRKDQIETVVSNGERTHGAIANAIDLSQGGTNYHLREMLEQDRIVRVSLNGEYHYYLPDSEMLGQYDESEIERTNPSNRDGGDGEESQDSEGAEETAETNVSSEPESENEESEGYDPMNVEDAGDFEIPVIGGRNYDWDDFVPEDKRFYESGLEKSKFEAVVKKAKVCDMETAVSVEGDTGTGKSSMIESVAHDEEIAYFEIQCHPELTTLEMFGKDTPSADGFVWQDGPVIKALLCSRERLTILNLDEANRAPSHAKNALFGVLDHRCRLETGRGNEVIVGKRENLIVVSTLNIGPEFPGTEKLDRAGKRRYGLRLETDYLGRAHPEREIKLLREETAAGPIVAEAMVKKANEVREQASRDKIMSGVPTSVVLKWARTAAAYDTAGIGKGATKNGSGERGPISEAAIDAIIRPFYGEDTNDGQEVKSIIVENKFDDAPFAEGEFVEWCVDRNVDPIQQSQYVDVSHDDYGVDFSKFGVNGGD